MKTIKTARFELEAMNNEELLSNFKLICDTIYDKPETVFDLLDAYNLYMHMDNRIDFMDLNEALDVYGDEEKLSEAFGYEFSEDEGFRKYTAFLNCNGDFLISKNMREAIEFIKNHVEFLVSGGEKDLLNDLKGNL